MYNLYIGDVNEHNVLGWVIENIGPLIKTKKDKYQYYETYYGKDWLMNTSDVSDVSGQYDTITLIVFESKEDALLTKVRWGGSLS